jgi:hypothetical protein
MVVSSNETCLLYSPKIHDTAHSPPPRYSGRGRSGEGASILVVFYRGISFESIALAGKVPSCRENAPGIWERLFHLDFGHPLTRWRPFLFQRLDAVIHEGPDRLEKFNAGKGEVFLELGFPVDAFFQVKKKFSHRANEDFRFRILLGFHVHFLL